MERKLYRYRSFDSKMLKTYSDSPQGMIDIEKWKLEAFEGLVVPSSPLYFNDPYDCAFCFQSDVWEWLIGGREGVIQILEKRFPLKQEEKNRILCSDDIDREVQRVCQSHGLERPEPLSKLMKSGLSDKMDKIRETVGVVCLSELCDSMLMWSHYAQSHTGYCIEYSFEESNMFYKQLFPVVYTKDRYAIPKADISADRGNEWLYKPICHKSAVWEYEKEWRIVINNFNKVMQQKQEYPEGECFLNLKSNIKAFYLGAMILPKFKDEVVRFGKERGIAIYQMELSKKAFELVAKKI